MLALLAGVATLVAFRDLLHWRKFGEAALQLTILPGVIGGLLCGRIHLPAHIRPQEGFTLQLQCVKHVTTKSGNNTRTSKNNLWNQAQFVPNAQVQAGLTRATVPVRFEICQDLPGSGSASSVRIAWYVDITAAVPGIDYAATFEVPVFKRCVSA